MKCDVCGAEVEREEDFQKHNKDNYVKHVFLSHPDDEARIYIIQNYIRNYARKA